MKEDHDINNKIKTNNIIINMYKTNTHTHTHIHTLYIILQVIT